MCMTRQSHSLVLRSLDGAALHWSAASLVTSRWSVDCISSCVVSESVCVVYVTPAGALSMTWLPASVGPFTVCLRRLFIDPSKYRTGLAPMRGCASALRVVNVSPPGCCLSWEARSSIRIWMHIVRSAHACIMNELASFIKSCWLHIHWSDGVGVDVRWRHAHIS